MFLLITQRWNIFHAVVQRTGFQRVPVKKYLILMIKIYHLIFSQYEPKMKNQHQMSSHTFYQNHINLYV
jgi:hypothetical protein